MSELRVRLFIDECVHSASADAFRDTGFDARHASEVHRRHLSDDEQLEFAADEGMALLTYNVKDFARIHGEWLTAGRHHAGILLARDYKRDVGGLVRDVRDTLKMHIASNGGAVESVLDQTLYVQRLR